MAKMRAVQVTEADGPFQNVERDIPEPGIGWILIKVEACGLCHSDSFTKEGKFPGLSYPRIPGHEIAGVVDAVGSDATGLRQGQRVGVGWYGGRCGHCPPCRRGDFINCVDSKVPGIHFDGGYADYIIVPAEAAVRIPEGIPATEAAPLMCAGVTTFNALRNSGARGGDIVAVLGIGGLGHLGIQYAVKMGFRTVAIARGREKAELSRQLGAHEYIDSEAEDVAEELLEIGGAKVILATATSGKAMTAAIGGLAADGKLMVIGAAEDPLEVHAHQLIMGRKGIQGWPSGTSFDTEQAVAFSRLTGVKPMVEVFPLLRAAEAYDRMMSGKARFRVVLSMGK